MCPQVLRVVFLQVIGGSVTTLYEQAFYQFATSPWMQGKCDTFYVESEHLEHLWRIFSKGVMQRLIPQI